MYMSFSAIYLNTNSQTTASACDESHTDGRHRASTESSLRQCLPDFFGSLPKFEGLIDINRHQERIENIRSELLISKDQIVD